MPRQNGEAAGKAKTKRAKTKRRQKKAQGSRKLYTLSEVSRRTGISMPTLQRYKKLYQDRIPSQGEGRRQRYPASAIPVFKKLKQENLKRRGRPKGSSSSGSLLTLSEIGRRTGISYPTLLRYVKLHLDRIPHEGEGRSRRYPESAVKVFRDIRASSRRGRKVGMNGAGRIASGVDPQLQARIRELEKAQRQLSRQLQTVIDTLKKPLHVTIRPR